MAGFTYVDDVTRVFIGSTPAGANLAGYTTGSNGIGWFSADWTAHPTAVRIDQDWQASDATADVLDVENGAATPGECAGWVKRALANYAAAARPGQRQPAIYMSLNQVSAVTAALHAGGVTGGVTLWIADWMNNQAQAQSMIGTTYSGFPVSGVQYRNAGAYDMDVFDATWWSVRSASHPAFPLKLGSNDNAATGLVHTLQANINRWAAKLGYSVSIGVDGIYGPVTATAVAAAQLLFGEQGMPEGTCDQAMFSKLAGAVPVVPPATPPAPGSLKAMVTSTGAHASLTWGNVPNVELYTYQLEHYKQKFGWVLDVTKTVSTNFDTQLVAPKTKFRFRASSGTWSAWSEFTTS